MVGHVVRPTLSIRCAIILAAAVALALPIPARCASCAAGASECAHCRAASKTATPSGTRPCCQRHTATHGAVAAEATNCVHVQSRTCGCNIQPVDRTYASADQRVSVSDHLAALPSVQPLLFNATRGRNSAATAFTDLPPPVPHRILHCSWII